MDSVITLRQISVTALFYLEESRKIHLSGVRARRSKETRRRAPQRAGERELPLAPLFICLSLSRPVLCKLGQPGVLFVLPEVLTLVLGPSFVSFSQAFPFLVCGHRRFGPFSLCCPPDIIDLWSLAVLSCDPLYFCGAHCNFFFISDFIGLSPVPLFLNESA